MKPGGKPVGATLVCMRGITKRFGPVTVLDNVDFEVRAGEVHILAGENGAGKSTLIKILGGAHHPDRGEILLRGQARHMSSPTVAQAAECIDNRRRVRE